MAFTVQCIRTLGVDKGKQAEGVNLIQDIVWSLLAWPAVGMFWLVTTRSFHPTWNLALTTTASLITAFAGASYVNHRILK